MQRALINSYITDKRSCPTSCRSGHPEGVCSLSTSFPSYPLPAGT